MLITMIMWSSFSFKYFEYFVGFIFHVVAFEANEKKTKLKRLTNTKLINYNLYTEFGIRKCPDTLFFH